MFDQNPNEMKTVPLEQPIKRDGGDITALQLRRFDSGALRGVSMAKLGELQLDEVRKVVPRISIPTITETEFDGIDGADMLEICLALSDFLFTKRRKADFSTT